LGGPPIVTGGLGAGAPIVTGGLGAGAPLVNRGLGGAPLENGGEPGREAGGPSYPAGCGVRPPPAPGVAPRGGPGAPVASGPRGGAGEEDGPPAEPQPLDGLGAGRHHPDVAPETPGRPPGDGQADPHPPVLARDGSVDLVERLEDPVNAVRTDA